MIRRQKPSSDYGVVGSFIGAFVGLIGLSIMDEAMKSFYEYLEGYHAGYTDGFNSAVEAVQKLKPKRKKRKVSK
jgi:hypothetical protein